MIVLVGAAAWITTTCQARSRPSTVTCARSRLCTCSMTYAPQSSFVLRNLRVALQAFGPQQLDGHTAAQRGQIAQNDLHVCEFAAMLLGVIVFVVHATYAWPWLQEASAGCATAGTAHSGRGGRAMKPCAGSPVSSKAANSAAVFIDTITCYSLKECGASCFWRE